MEHSKMSEVSPKSGSESHTMLAANEFSNVISSSYSAAKDEGCSSKYSRVNNIIAPKVRVVHVYEPKIIKTEPENFRTLVQRLTGKSSHKSNEKKRQANHRSSFPEVSAAKVGSENLEYKNPPFYSSEQLSIMGSETIKFSTEDCSDMIFSSQMSQDFFDDIPLVIPGPVDRALSSEVITAELATENRQYTFYCNNEPAITKNNTANLTEDCSGISKGFADKDQETVDEIPLVWNNSPFCNMDDHIGL